MHGRRVCVLRAKKKESGIQLGFFLGLENKDMRRVCENWKSKASRVFMMGGKKGVAIGAEFQVLFMFIYQYVVSSPGKLMVENGWVL